MVNRFYRQVAKTVRRQHPRGRKIDHPPVSKLSQQTSAGNVLELSSAIAPIPKFGKFTAQSVLAPRLISFSEFPHGDNVPVGKQATLDSSWRIHDHLRTTFLDQSPEQNKVG